MHTRATSPATVTYVTTVTGLDAVLAVTLLPYTDLGLRGEGEVSASCAARVAAQLATAAVQGNGSARGVQRTGIRCARSLCVKAD